MRERLASTLNELGLSAIATVLLFAFYAQFTDNELPCPLCLLQRAGFVMVGLCPDNLVSYEALDSPLGR